MMPHKHKRLFYIAVFEIIVGFSILICDIYDYFNLYSYEEADIVFGGVIDLIKYKENTFLFMYYGAVTMIAGILFWIKPNYYLIGNKIVLITSLLSLPLFNTHHLNGLSIPFIPLLLVALTIYIEVFYRKVLRVKSNSTDIMAGIILGIVSGFICWVLRMI